MNRIVKRLAVPLSAAAVLGTAGFAYMASNTVPESYAGSGQGTVSGYTVGNINYQTSGLNVDGVQFTLDQAAAPANVKAVLGDNGSGWRGGPAAYQSGGGHSFYNCSAVSGGTTYAVGTTADAPANSVWTCVAGFGNGATPQFTNFPIGALGSLTVSSAQ